MLTKGSVPTDAERLEQSMGELISNKTVLRRRDRLKSVARAAPLTDIMIPVHSRVRQVRPLLPRHHQGLREHKSRGEINTRLGGINVCRDPHAG